MQFKLGTREQSRCPVVVDRSRLSICYCNSYMRVVWSVHGNVRQRRPNYVCACPNLSTDEAGNFYSCARGLKTKIWSVVLTAIYVQETS